MSYQGELEGQAAKMNTRARLQEQVIEQMRADYDVLGERYLRDQKEIEELQGQIVTLSVALKAENDRLRLALKEIYYSSNEATIRNTAWDAAHQTGEASAESGDRSADDASSVAR